MYPLMTSNATVLGSSLISNKILLLVFCESKFNASGIDFFYNVHFKSKCRNPLFRSHWFFFVLSLNSCLFRSFFCRRCYLLFFIIFLIHLLTSFAIFCFTSACGLSVFEETNTTTLSEKCPNTEFFFGPYFTVFSPNAEKYGPENSVFGHFSRSPTYKAGWLGLDEVSSLIK